MEECYSRKPIHKDGFCAWCDYLCDTLMYHINGTEEVSHK